MSQVTSKTKDPDKLLYRVRNGTYEDYQAAEARLRMANRAERFLADHLKMLNSSPSKSDTYVVLNKDKLAGIFICIEALSEELGLRATYCTSIRKKLEEQGYDVDTAVFDWSAEIYAGVIPKEFQK